MFKAAAVLLSIILEVMGPLLIFSSLESRPIILRNGSRSFDSNREDCLGLESRFMDQS